MSVKMYRKIIKITCEDSPNVRLARAEQAMGRKPSGTVIIEGVLPWADLQQREATWDDVRKCIGLRAEFYEGGELLLFPPLLYDRSSSIESSLPANRTVRAMGIDPAEGGDKSTWAWGDEYGLMGLLSKKTPNTRHVIDITLGLMKDHKIPDDKVMFDRGGGGQQHADTLRNMGHDVGSVGFGTSPTQPVDDVKAQTPDRQEYQDRKYTYASMRVEMYHKLSIAVCSPPEVRPYCLPRRYTELRRQLAVMPKSYNEREQMVMPPKRHKPGTTKKEPSLHDMLGCSPDEADAVVLMYHSLKKRGRPEAGAIN